ncbi:hypothetical protein PV05_01697 [Exophiala xenobiotica]|uniref:Ig-like domain-containing protein n=1 Tax=Exophiala xenobiotica TaxID=348802 RepID=A0A0D2F3Q1_9EURO|nr:uncharacterized protein PV05_01697 [Exophiala xenobiotica]KIW61595.1 hypothetical protein PV05_01697 [Exophiala xenobiotica]
MTLKNLPIVAALSLASISTTVLAQAPITIQGGTYDGQAIAGQHVGAAQSYQVALSQRTGSSLSASGDGFTYNLTSKMYMDWSIVSGQSLPCYIIDEDSIGNGTGGPLECGAATNANYPITATLDPQGNVNFDAVESWWVCSVNATSPYGMTKGTVVGGFTSAMPVGAGIADCEAIDGLKIGGGGSSSTTTTTTTKPASSTPVTTTTTGTSTKSTKTVTTTTSGAWTTSVSTPASTAASSSWTQPWGSSSASISTSTVVVPATTVSTTTPSVASSTVPAVVTYTGGASALKGVSGLGMIVAAGAAMMI